jgi:tetratricopeptide (TPR) repeat protein
VEAHTRLDELRRRVDKDPASIAFAPLAEELRKAGEWDEAVRVCQAGLEHHPAYLSARVTLGRALLELQRYSEARAELEYVLRAAPDNLLAQKGMNELADREHELAERERHVAPAPEIPFETTLAEAALPTVPEPPSLVVPEPPPPGAAPDPPAVHPALGDLERWQARIQADRAQRTGRT